MASVQNYKKRLIGSVTTLILIVIVCVCGWLGGDFLSKQFSSKDNIINGDFNAFIVNKPVLYVTEGCSACKLAKSFVKEHGINVEIRVINSNPRWAQDLKKLGVSSVPVLVQKSKVTVGFSATDYLLLN
ncbi:MAG: hypothetical protein HRU25_12870 [Psychrobium sp.]|nr:hypothetical protein [Psychrobium sp.]